MLMQRVREMHLKFAITSFRLNKLTKKGRGYNNIGCVRNHADHQHWIADFQFPEAMQQ